MKKQKVENIIENIVPQDMDEVLIGAFNRYAKIVITDRAIPDCRDGLKPVQRRIIYSMFKKGYLSTKPTVKCATIVGDIMGHYHPHGDSSIYEALVHLSQPWKCSAPLVSFQGNNGGLDNDMPADKRYTEAKLSPLADYMVKDIEKNTVTMVPTFDDMNLEPTVLPSRFPNLLVNGTQGIAVGSSTCIPTHNLSEVIEATIYRISHKRANLDDMLNFIKGPDFPTGGIIDDKKALRKIYEEGKGSFYLYAHAYIDEEKNAIIIDELPYGVIKKELVMTLNKRKESDNLNNIEEILDESAKGYVRISINLKQGSSAQDLLNYLQQKGLLKTTIACNLLAIYKGHPKTMSLLELIDAYIEHQREVENKATLYDLDVAKRRLEIVDGLLKVTSILDEVIAKIRKCNGKESVKKMLMSDYSFTENQSEAIAMLPLYRLSNTDIVALENENKELLKNIDLYNSYLSDPDKLDRKIISSLKEIEKKFSSHRRTVITEEKLTFSTVDQTKLIAKEDCVVSLTYDGYAKRTSPKSYKAFADSESYTLPKTKAGDHVVFLHQASTHDSLLLFTNKGNYAYLPVYFLPDIKWKEEGKHLNNLITLKNDEKIVRCFLVNDFRDDINVAILTSSNKIKRTKLSEFKQSTLTKRTLRCCKLINEKDSLVDVAFTTGNSDLIVVDKMGRASRYNENEVPLVSLTAIGVKAIASSIDNSPLVSLISLTSKEVSLLLVVSNRRACRLISTAKIQSSERLGAKVNLVRIFKKNPMNIISVNKIKKDKNTPSFASVTSQEERASIDLADLSPIDLNSEMRENIPLDSKNEIIGVDNLGEIIDESFESEASTVKVNKVKAKVDKADTQLSLFDLFEKERNQ